MYMYNVQCTQHPTCTCIYYNNTCTFMVMRLMTVSKKYDCFPTGLIYMYVNIHVCITCASMHYIHIVKKVASFLGGGKREESCL